MIYLAIDTDVWLWLSYHRIDTEENFFDELFFWLQSVQLRCIVPENIIKEWERNKQTKVDAVKLELNRAAQFNKDLFRDPKFFNTVYNSENFEAFAKTRIERYKLGLSPGFRLENPWILGRDSANASMFSGRNPLSF